MKQFYHLKANDFNIFKACCCKHYQNYPQTLSFYKQTDFLNFYPTTAKAKSRLISFLKFGRLCVCVGGGGGISNFKVNFLSSVPFTSPEHPLFVAPGCFVVEWGTIFVKVWILPDELRRKDLRGWPPLHQQIEWNIFHQTSSHRLNIKVKRYTNMKSFIAKRVLSILVNLRYLRFKLLKCKEK